MQSEYRLNSEFDSVPPSQPEENLRDGEPESEAVTLCMSDYLPQDKAENRGIPEIAEETNPPRPEIETKISIVRAPLETKEEKVKAVLEPPRKFTSQVGAIAIPDELLEANAPVLGEMDLPETVRIPPPLRLKDSVPKQRTDAPQKPRSCAFTAARIKLPSIIENENSESERFPACVEFVPQIEPVEKNLRSKAKTVESAVAAKSDHSIRNVISAWPELPIQVRRAILELIKANLPARV